MIKIIKGTYGYQVVDSEGKVLYVKPKTSKDEPFVLSAEQEARLVREGVAEYVGEPELPELPEGVEGIPEYSMENTAAELREIAALMGLEFAANAKKQDMIDAMDEFLAENMTDEDGEPLPEIDAAEAVE